MERTGLFYVRDMDDILVLSPTRLRLRKAVKAVNLGLGSLRLEKHPDKTVIGRVGRGFDFLGYRLEPGKLTVAEGAVHNFVMRIDRLYEQGAGSNGVDRYVKRWVHWAKSGIGKWVEETGGERKGQAPDLHMPLQVIAAGMF